MDRNAPDAPQFTSLDIEKSVSEPRAELRPLPRNMFTRRPTKIVFLQNSWSCLQDYRGAGRRRKSQLDGATDFLSTISQHITTASFVSAFIFVLTEKPSDVKEKKSREKKYYKKINGRQKNCSNKSWQEYFLINILFVIINLFGILKICLHNTNTITKTKIQLVIIKSITKFSWHPNILASKVALEILNHL